MAEAFNITVPQGSNYGLFRSASDFGSQLYRVEPNGSFTPFALGDFGREMLGAKGDAGAQAGKALDYLQTNLGINYNSLPAINMADYVQHIQSKGLQGNPSYKGDLQSFVGAKSVAPTVTVAKNTAVETYGLPEKNQATQTASAPVQPVGTPNPPLQSNLPGANATNLYDYYNAQGKALPTVSERGALFQNLGLGTSSGYTGSAYQNEQLLAALQRKDYSATTIGSPAASASPAYDATPAGSDLARALSGSSVSDTLSNYRIYLASALGRAAETVSKADTALDTFFGNMLAPEDILRSEMSRLGISSQQNLLTELDRQITSQTKLLERIPDDIRTTLADVGVSQAQLDRLVLRDIKKPTELLKDLLTQRNATSQEMDRALSFAKSFAETRIAGQAAKLSALEWMVNSAKGDYRDANADVKSALNLVINEQKEVFEVAKQSAENGASRDIIDAILSSGSKEEALRAAGTTAKKPKDTTSTSSLTKELQGMQGMLEVGYTSPTNLLIHYSGRGPDGFVDPGLYVMQYNYIRSIYGNAGIAEYFSKFPPEKYLNPSSIGKGILPPEIENKLKATVGKKSGTIQ